MNDQDKPTVFEQTHIAMVLDRSGSMSSCRAETIGAVNSYLAKARTDDNLKEADFTLSIFDNQSIDTIRDGAPIRVADLAEADFVPRGYTPLYDAIGRGVKGLDDKLVKNKSTKAVLVIVTDGHENASRKYGHGQIATLIKARQEAGWMVVFLGAGLDAARQGTALGVNIDTVASISTDPAAMAETSSYLASASMGYARNATGAQAKSWRAGGGGSISRGMRMSMGDKTGGDGLKGNAGGGLRARVPGGGGIGTAPPLQAAEATDTWDKAKDTEQGVDRDAWNH